VPIERNEIPEQLLREIGYDPETGRLFWLGSRGRRKVGTEAGNVHKGRIRVKYTYKYYFAHRIAWTKVYGKIPDDLEIDHKNVNSLDNRLCNLRLSTHSQNNANGHKMGRLQTSKYKGVYWNKRQNKWQAQITVDGKNRYLGLFEDEYQAHLAFVRASAEAFGEFARAA
jgi:hypothetical protein